MDFTVKYIDFRLCIQPLSKQMKLFMKVVKMGYVLLITASTRRLLSKIKRIGWQVFYHYTVRDFSLMLKEAIIHYVCHYTSVRVKVAWQVLTR